MDSPPLFNSVEDECRYWKERAKLYHKEWTDVKQEYDEFVEQSREMENEMDATLDQKMATIRDLTLKLSILESENASLKQKVDANSVDYLNIERQLENVTKERDAMKDYLRQLEQKNDDLERAHRILSESILNFEKMLDEAYEKNALLEIEVDEKEILQEKLQRLMDETRDLKEELNVKTRYTTTVNGTIGQNCLVTNGGCPLDMSNVQKCINGDLLLANRMQNIVNNSNSTSNTSLNSLGISLNEQQHEQQQHQHSNIQQRTLKRRQFTDNTDNIINGNAMPTSTRTTALNIVADMLKKLNAMETKLKTYREQTPAMQPRQ